MSRDAVKIRSATMADAPAIQAIYAPIVRDTVISFETEVPTVQEIARRI
jgi:phosphinothricin acetyltransferase